jgi:hypothetical protein
MLVRMQLEWRASKQAESNPYRGDEGQDIKTYMIDRFGLQVFIQTL